MITTVFADRDGTLNVKAPAGSYITAPGDVVLLPGAATALRRLNAAGVRVVVATNQRGIARGLMTTTDYDRVRKRLDVLLEESGAHIDATYVCPHDIDACSCRKPLPGLLLQAMADLHEVTAPTSVMIGDSPSDVEAGLGAGVRTIRIAAAPDAAADHTASSFAAAVDWLFDSGEIGT